MSMLHLCKFDAGLLRVLAKFAQIERIELHRPGGKSLLDADVFEIALDQGVAGIVTLMAADGLMAVFGAPHPQPDPCDSAVRTALEMLETIVAEVARELQMDPGAMTRLLDRLDHAAELFRQGVAPRIVTVGELRSLAGQGNGPINAFSLASFSSCCTGSTCGTGGRSANPIRGDARADALLQRVVGVGPARQCPDAVGCRRRVGRGARRAHRRRSWRACRGGRGA